MVVRLRILSVALVLAFALVGPVRAGEAEVQNGAPHVEIDPLNDKSIHDDSWWKPAYKEAAGQNDCTKVMSILTRAQKAGNITAHGTLGEFYHRGLCGDKDIKKAKTLLRYGAERGEAWDAAYLAQIYFIEKGEHDPAAKEWAHRAQFAMIRMGSDTWKKVIPYLHIDGPLSPHLQQAFSWLENIENEDAEILFNIGKDFLEHGTWPESKVLACYWLDESSRKGHVRASYLLARQVIMGDGVLVAPVLGTTRLYDAFEGGDVDAFLFAAQILEQGHVVDQSYLHAYVALMRAQNLGADVTDSIDRVFPHLTDYERHIVESFYAQDPSIPPRVLYVHVQNESSNCSYASR
ncbi:tetratricopeptide repeat protein [Pseudomonadota bacterium]